MAYLRFFLTHPRALSFGVLLTLFSSFGQTFLISIFVPRLLEEFALNTAQFGALYALATITSAASLMTALWAEIYGVESLGAIKGIVATFGIFATALGPISLGWLLKVGCRSRPSFRGAPSSACSRSCSASSRADSCGPNQGKNGIPHPAKATACCPSGIDRTRARRPDLR